MSKTEYLIVGQGISGTFMSWYLYKAGRSFLVIDNNEPRTSSRVAAGIINPVTGRRIVRTWMIDIVLPFALSAYEEIGNHLDIQAIARKKMIDFFPSAQMLNAFTERINENEDYLSMPGDTSTFHDQFNYDLGYGEIDPCYMVNLQELLTAWRKALKKNNCLIEDNFNVSELSIEQHGITYQDISAEKIIFCDGIYSSQNNFFKNLPFALNKGEALIIISESIPENYIYKKGIALAPLGDKLFWAGSSHEWNFTDNEPSDNFLEKTTSLLSLWLKQPYRIVSHLSSIRPATVERRPFVGIHPHYPSIGILNGMGTKGCSLSPFFADQFVNHLIKNTAILPEADINRFSRILKSSF